MAYMSSLMRSGATGLALGAFAENLLRVAGQQFMNPVRRGAPPCAV
jgi:hypothetical protein